MTIEQRRALRTTAKAMGLGTSSVKQLMQHGQILEPGRHPADLLRAIRRERTGHVPAMHGVDLADSNLQSACQTLREGSMPNAAPEAAERVTPLKVGPKRPRGGR